MALENFLSLQIKEEIFLKNKIDIQQILQAAKRLDGVVNDTPVLTSRTFNQLTGLQVFFKCENFQRGGAFKFRGAYNFLSQLTDEQKRRGVVAFSSGNHAQGVALAANILGIQAVIVMPKDAPQIKIDAVKGYGSQIIFFDRFTEDREEITRQYSAEHGMIIVPPFNHPYIIAGAGTATVELLREIPDLDILLTPVGGGGLISGTSIAAHGMLPSIRVIGVEPDTADDTRQSIELGNRVSIPPSNTIADGLRAMIAGELTFPIIQKHVEQIVTVSEEEIREALRFAITRMKLVIEPSSAVPLAALLSGKVNVKKGKRVGVIVSGGNLEPALLGELF